ncbi:MAG TPA: hypothetical protein ENK50_01945 [Sedimenticola sp.]|nr:hypothetical protein [Sedimenticola sp.]
MLLIITLILLIIAGGLYLEHRRGANLSATATRMGFVFQGDRKRLPESLARAGFDLFTQGGSEVSNWMQGEMDGVQVALFDYGFEARTAGEGEGVMPVSDDQQGREQRLQSVAWVRTGASLPDFDLAPADGHRRTVAARFGLDRLTFDGDAGFNREYVLLARDAGRVRRLFTPALRRWLLAHPGLVVESRGGDLLVYRFGERLDPQRIPGFATQVEALFRLLPGNP